MSKMSIETKLRVTEIQRFCMHDGPGVRTTVFLKGCPLRCAWCHNPEAQMAEPELLLNAARCIGCLVCVSVCPSGAQAFAPVRTADRDTCRACGACSEACPTAALEICGREYTADELADVIERDRAFYGERGGVTLSGGEPLLQGEGTLALLRECRERGIPTAVETCGFADPSVIEAAVPHVDLFLWDVKDTDDVRHKRYTGVSCARIIENLRRADSLGAKTRLRCILVKGVNTDAAHYRALAELAVSLAGCEGVEFIPYHAYGGSKATLLGLPDNGNAAWIPEKEDVTAARAAVASHGIKVY